MPRISKHQRKFVAMEEASSGLKSRLGALAEEMELFNQAIASFKTAPGDESGFQGPTVDMKKWLAECEESVLEIKEPLASSVFFTKIIMEALCAGTVSERDLKAAVIDTCRTLGIRSTGRGTISGLGIDVTTVCGVLLCLGISESTTIAAPVQSTQQALDPSASVSNQAAAGSSASAGSGNPNEGKPISMLQLFRNSIALASIQQRNGMNISCQHATSSSCSSSSSSSSSGIGGFGGGESSANSATSGNDDNYMNSSAAASASEQVPQSNSSFSVNLWQPAATGSDDGPTANVKMEELSTAEANVRAALAGLSSLEDYDAILQAELSLLQSETGKSLVGRLVSRWAGLLGRYYQDARRSALRGGYLEIPGPKPKPSPKSSNNNAGSAGSVATSVSESDIKMESTDTGGAGAGAGAGGNDGGSVDGASIKSEGGNASSTGIDQSNNGLNGTSTESGDGSVTPASASASASASRNTSPRVATQRAWKITDEAANAQHLVNPAGVLQHWMQACYDEAAAKEMEETVVRRLAGQCNIPLDAPVFRHGTRFLNDTLRLTADGLVVPHAVTGAEASFGEGAQFTGSALWAKARRRYKRTHPSAPSKHTMPLTHPYHQHHGSNSSEHFNYDSQALHLYSMRRAESEKMANSTKSKGKMSGAWNDPNYALTSGPYINPRYSLPVGWNRTDMVSRVNESMQLDNGLYAVLNQSSYPLVGTAIYPDLMIITSEVPWSLVAREFMVMHAEDMDMSRDHDRSPRLSGRSNSRGSFDFSGFTLRPNSSSHLLSTTSSDGLDNDEKGGNGKAGGSGSRKRRAGTEGTDSAPSSPRRRVDTVDYTADGERPFPMARSKSQSSLGLGLQALKDAEVFAPSFRPTAFDLNKAVAQLKKDGFVPSSEKMHIYIKIGTPGGMLTAGGNGDSFARAAALKEGEVNGKEQNRSLSRDRDDNSGSGDASPCSATEDPFAAFSASSYDPADMSDEAINFRHERVLKNMRDRWTKLAKLKREQRELKLALSGGFDANSPRAMSAAGSPRSSGGIRHRRKSGGSRSRANSASRIAYAARSTSTTPVGSAEALSASVKRRGRPSKSPLGSPTSTAGFFTTEEEDFTVQHLHMSKLLASPSGTDGSTSGSPKISSIVASGSGTGSAASSPNKRSGIALDDAMDI